MKTTTNRTFKGERVLLDDHSYADCTFVNCELVFSGVGKVGLARCVFDGVRWTFEGAAAKTAQFMKALFDMGPEGRRLIERTFGLPDKSLN